MNEIHEKLIIGIRKNDPQSKKEIISLTHDILIQTIYKRYIGLEEKEIN